MGFAVQCDNHGCREYQEPQLDMKDSQDPTKWVVICSECQKPIKSVTYFTKVQLRHMGQILKQHQQRQSFSVKCDYCGKIGRPKLGIDNVILCFDCGKEHTNLTSQFKKMLLNLLKNNQI